MWTQGSDFTFLFLNADTVFGNSNPEEFAKIWPIERIGLRKKFAIVRTNLLSDVFAAVTVVATEAPYCPVSNRERLDTSAFIME